MERSFNPLNAELNPICYLLALLAHHFLHVSRIRVKSLTLRLLMSYIYIYDISSLRVNDEDFFRSLRKTAKKKTVSIVISVRLSVRMVQLRFHWMDFRET